MAYSYKNIRDGLRRTGGCNRKQPRSALQPSSRAVCRVVPAYTRLLGVVACATVHDIRGRHLLLLVGLFKLPTLIAPATLGVVATVTALEVPLSKEHPALACIVAVAPFFLPLFFL